MKWLIIAVVMAVVAWVMFGQSAVDWAFNIINGGSFKREGATSRVVVTPEARRIAQQGLKDDVAP